MSIIVIENLLVFLFFVILFLLSLKKRSAKVCNDGQISPETSTALKAFCCILIIMHHYAMRVHGGFLGAVLAVGGGNFSLSIFLLLSAYGITKSEYKNSLGLEEFVNKRVKRVFIPYAIWITIFFIIYWLIGAAPDADAMKQGRVTPSFSDIGSHQIGVIHYFRYLFGMDSFCGHLWFVGVTLYNYLAFFLSKNLFSLKSEKTKCFFTYCILIVLFGIVTMVFQFPAHYWRNLWALVLGLFIALFEGYLKKLPRLKLIIMYVLGNILVTAYLYITHSGNIEYILFANLGIFSIILLNVLFQKYTIEKGSFIALLAVLSYSIYIVHGMLLTLEWWYIGFQSLTLIVVSSIALAYVYERIQSYFKRLKLTRNE